MIRARLISIAMVAAFAGAPVSAQPVGQEQAQKAAQEAPAADPRIAASARVLQSSLDALRAGNFEGWIARYSPNIVIQSPHMIIKGRKELRAIYRVFFDAGVPSPTILESGWTGERIYVRQREFLPEGTTAGVTYAEYEVKGGLITSVNAYIE